MIHNIWLLVFYFLICTLVGAAVGGYVAGEFSSKFTELAMDKIL